MKQDSVVVAAVYDRRNLTMEKAPTVTDRRYRITIDGRLPFFRRSHVK